MERLNAASISHVNAERTRPRCMREQGVCLECGGLDRLMSATTAASSESPVTVARAPHTMALRHA